MKYVELKASLKSKIEKTYLISGDDRYLCYDALKKIEDALAITIKDMNAVTLSGEQVSAKDIVDSANMYPFGDMYRLVVVKNFAPTKNKAEFEVIQKYVSTPLDSTVLVFFNPDSADFFKGMKDITPIDCSKIDAKTISAFVKNFLAKNEISSTEETIEKLIMYCSSDMARITNELEKLSAYVAKTKVLTTEVVEDFVVQDKEYQIFQLAEFIAKKDAKNAIDLVDSFMVKPGSAFTILSPLYNNYRRALFVSINSTKTPAELASLLGVKEFAVKMLKNQVACFSPKQLKQIVDMIADYDTHSKTWKQTI
jgi:DNA polymerase III delta subunit